MLMSIIVLVAVVAMFLMALGAMRSSIGFMIIGGLLFIGLGVGIAVSGIHYQTGSTSTSEQFNDTVGNDTYVYTNTSTTYEYDTWEDEGAENFGVIISLVGVMAMFIGVLWAVGIDS